jgi:hypothetical protein
MAKVEHRSGSWDFAHPFDRKVKGSGLGLNPLTRLFWRGAELCSGCPAEKLPARICDCIFPYEGANKFVRAAWLDPREQIAIGCHVEGIHIGATASYRNWP